MVGDWQCQQDRCAARPPVHQTVEATLRWEVQHLINTRRCQQLSERQQQCSRYQPNFHMQGVAEQQAKESSMVRESSLVRLPERLACNKSDGECDECEDH